MKTRKNYLGFSLVEMAIVLIIIGLFISAFLTPLSAQKDQRDYLETRNTLEKIRDSLYGYAILNGNLPCPTTTANPADNTNYGHKDAICPTAAQGYLPWKDLGMREVDSWGTTRSAATDQWSGYWIYRVDPAFNATISLIPTATTPSIDMNLTKADGTSLTVVSERAVAIVCSTGKNKKADGQNASFEVAKPTYQDDVQSPNFDDICIWITRPSLFNRMVAAGRLP
jgi:type II secretory pathway pseudopilin PulG